MKRIVTSFSRQFHGIRARIVMIVLTLGILGIAVISLGTPPFGFFLNQILARGVVPGSIGQHIQINKNPDGSVEPWQLQLQVQGDTDVYMQRLELLPGGYSGWHTHPGLLIGTVVAGQIDFYNSRCEKRTVTAGEVYTEDDNVHGIINTGSVNAVLFISYLIKHDAPRRLEAPAPDCAFSTGIP